MLPVFPYWMHLRHAFSPREGQVHEDKGHALGGCSEQGPLHAFTVFRKPCFTCWAPGRQQRARQLWGADRAKLGNALMRGKWSSAAGEGGESDCGRPGSSLRVTLEPGAQRRDGVQSVRAVLRPRSRKAYSRNCRAGLEGWRVPGKGSAEWSGARPWWGGQKLLVGFKAGGTCFDSLSKSLLACRVGGSGERQQSGRWQEELSCQWGT